MLASLRVAYKELTHTTCFRKIGSKFKVSGLNFEPETLNFEPETVFVTPKKQTLSILLIHLP